MSCCPDLAAPPPDPFWVFGYGSLMWQPGFDYVERQAATLHGWHRAMCILSNHYRGTLDKNGLVLGLDRGGSCRGIAFRIAAEHAVAVRQYLYDREMITQVYTPRYAKARLKDGQSQPVYIFTAKPDHEQYAGRLSLAQQAVLIRQGHGVGGACRDYLANTVRHMDQLGLRSSELHRLLKLVDRG